MKSEKIQPEPLEYGNLTAPPFYGTGEVLTWDTKALLDSIDRKRLYTSFSHDGKNNNSELPQGEEADFDELFNLLTQEILDDDLITARGFYSFFPVISDDETLILLSPNDFNSEIASFSFPRLKEKRWRSFADFFRPEGDIFSVLVGTIGFALDSKCMKYHQEKDIKEFYLNGIGNYLSEMITNKLNIEITRTLFLPKEQGLFSSYGQFGMPGLEQQKKLLELMCAEDRLGITLSEDFRLQPQHSYLGVYAHHMKSGVMEP